MYSQAEIEMFGQLDTVRHPDAGLGLLLVMPTAIADDVALVPLMTAEDIGVGIALVVLFAKLQVGKRLPRSL
jgi:hypothetical protein